MGQDFLASKALTLKRYWNYSFLKGAEDLFAKPSTTREHVYSARLLDGCSVEEGDAVMIRKVNGNTVIVHETSVVAEIEKPSIALEERIKNGTKVIDARIGDVIPGTSLVRFSFTDEK
jgi:hypothetical protein